MQSKSYLGKLPFSSVLRRGVALRELDGCGALFLSSAAGVDGSGFIVAVDRALSVEELVIELKREFVSCLVIVTTRYWQRRAEPYQFGRAQGGTFSLEPCCLRLVMKLLLRLARRLGLA